MLFSDEHTTMSISIRRVTMVQVLIAIWMIAIHSIFTCAGGSDDVTIQLEINPIITREDTLTVIKGLSIFDPDSIDNQHPYYTYLSNYDSNISFYKISLGVSHGTISFTEIHDGSDDMFHTDETLSQMQFSGTARAINSLLSSLSYHPSPNWSSCQNDPCVQEVQVIQIISPPENMMIQEDLIVQRDMSRGNDGLNIFLKCDAFMKAIDPMLTLSIEHVAYVSILFPWNATSLSTSFNDLIHMCNHHIYDSLSDHNHPDKDFWKSNPNNHIYAHVIEIPIEEYDAEGTFRFQMEFYNAPCSILSLVEWINLDNTTISNNEHGKGISIQIQSNSKSSSSSYALHDNVKGEFFQIGYPSQAKSKNDKNDLEMVSIPVGASAQEVETIMKQLNTIGDITVTHSYISTKKQEYEITFLDSGIPLHMGDLPLLTIAPSSNNSDFAFHVYEKRKGRANPDVLGVTLEKIEEEGFTTKLSHKNDKKGIGKKDSSWLLMSSFQTFVFPQNDLPLFDVPREQVFIMEEDSYLSLDELGFSISDQDDDILQLEVFSIDGSFVTHLDMEDDIEIIFNSLLPQGKEKVSYTNSYGIIHQKALVLQGPWQKMNDNLSRIRFVPNPDCNGVIDIDLTLTDNVGESSSHSFPVYIEPVNDLPIITVKKKEIVVQSHTEAHLGTFHISDVDVDDTHLTLTIFCKHGKLRFKNVLNRLKLSHFLEGNVNGDKLIVVRGKPPRLSEALGDLTYVSSKKFIGRDVVYFQLSDGSDDIVTSSINVTVIQQTPTFEMKVKNQRNLISMEEDTLWTNLDREFIIESQTDNDEDFANETLSILVSAKHGKTFQLYKVEDSNENVSMDQYSFEGNLRDANNFLQKLIYAPPRDFVGIDHLSLNLYHAARGFSSAKTMMVLVSPVNDNPIIECNTTRILVPEGSSIDVPSMSVSDPDVLNDMGDPWNSGMITVIGQSLGELTFDKQYSRFLPIRNCIELGANDLFLLPNRDLCFQGYPDEANMALSHLIYTAPIGEKKDTIAIVAKNNCQRLKDTGTLETNEKDDGKSKKIIHVDIKPNPKLKWVTPSNYEINEDSLFLFKPELTLQGSLPKGKMNTTIFVILSCSHGLFEVSPILLRKISVEVNGKKENKIILKGVFMDITVLLKDHGVAYVPHKDFNGVDRIELDAFVDVDRKVNTNDRVHVKILSVNDPPAIVTKKFLKGFQNKEINVTSLVLSDADENDSVFETLTLKIRVLVGKLRVRDISPGVWIVSMSDEIVLRGSMKSLNIVLASGLVYYNPPPEWTGTTKILFEVNDRESGPIVAETIIEIDFGPIDLSISVFPEQVTIFEDEQVIFSQAGILVAFQSSRSSGKPTFHCTISAQHGSIKSNFPKSGLVEEIGMSTNMTGPINEIRDILTTLIYTPIQNRNGLDEIQFECSHESKTITKALSIVIIAVNDPPKFVVSKGVVEFSEDSIVRLGSKFPQLYIIDPDAHENNDMMNVQITASNGYFRLPDLRFLGGLTGNLTDDKKKISLYGQIMKVNLALPEISLLFESNWVGDGILTFECDDLGNHRHSIPSKVHHRRDRKIIDFQVLPINDPPMIVFYNDYGISMIEDEKKSMKSLLSLKDVDSSGQDIFHLSLVIMKEEKPKLAGFHLSNDIEKLSHITFKTFVQVEDANVVSEIHANGTLKHLQDLVEELVIVPNRNRNGLCNCIKLSLTDPDAAQVTKNPIVSLIAVNDAPFFLASSNSVSVFEDTRTSLHDKVNITLFDHDLIDLSKRRFPSFLLLIKTNNGGKLQFDHIIPGCYVLMMTETSISFKGTINVVNEAIKQIDFIGCEDCDDSDVISFSVSDEGNFGLGGNLTSEFNVSVTIIGVNDAPRIVQHDAHTLLNPDSTLMYLFLDSRVSDVDGDIENDLISVALYLYPNGVGSLSITCEVTEKVVINKNRTNKDVLEMRGLEYDLNEALRCIRVSPDIIYDSNITIKIIATDRHGLSSEKSKIVSMKKTSFSPRLSSTKSTFQVQEEEIIGLGSVKISGLHNQTLDSQRFELEISSVSHSHLAVQNITSYAVDVPHPVQEISCQGHLESEGYFKLSFAEFINAPFSCITEDIFALSVGNSAEEERNGGPGKGTGESIESKLNSMACMKELDLRLEVHIMNQNSNTSHFEYIWRVTFHNAPFNMGLLSIIETSANNMDNMFPILSVREIVPQHQLRGSFALKLGSYVTRPIDATASEEYVQSTITELPDVSSVSVSRTMVSSMIQSFTWQVTFLCMNQDVATGNIKTMEVVNNTLKIGEKNGNVVVTTSMDRISDPELWKVETSLTHEPKIVQKIRLMGRGIRGFFTLSLEGIGTTGPIYLNTVGMKADELNKHNSLLDMTENSMNSVERGLGYGESVESLLLNLKYWPENTKVMVQRTEMLISDTNDQKKVVWEVTFKNPPVWFPTLKINHVDTLFGDSLKVFETKKVSDNLIGGVFKLSWDGFTTPALPYNITAEAMQMELSNLVKSGIDYQEIRIVRSNKTQYGSYIWTIVLFKSSSLNLAGANLRTKFIAIGTSLSGTGVQIETGLINAGPEIGKLFISKPIVKGLFFPSKDFRGDSEVIKVRGSTSSLNEALMHLVYTPAKDFYGLVTVYLSVYMVEKNSQRNEQTDSLKLNILVNNVDDPPLINWNETTLAITSKDSIQILEDTALHFEDYARNAGYASGIRVWDVDGGIGNLTVEITSGNGRFCADNEVQDWKKMRMFTRCENKGRIISFQGTLNEINFALSTLTYHAAEDWWGSDEIVLSVISDGKTTIDVIYVKVVPINDPPFIHIEGENRNITINAMEDAPLMIDVISISDRDTVMNCRFLQMEQYSCPQALDIKNELTLYLSASFGLIQVDSSIKDMSVSGGRGMGSKSIYLRGKINDVNAALATLIYTGEKNFHGSDVLVITAKDYGFSFDPVEGNVVSTSLSCTRNLVLEVSSVNDAPYITLPETSTGHLTALEDIAGVIGSECHIKLFEIRHSLSCDNIQIHDADLDYIDDSNNLQEQDEFTVKLIPKFGSIILQNVGSLEEKHDELNNSIEIKGRLNEINHALHGILYISGKNFNSESGLGFDNIEIIVEDIFGGIATSSLFIFVEPMNDAPVIELETVLTDQLLLSEDTQINVPISIKDVDLSQSYGLIEVEVFASNGKVFIDQNSKVQRWIAGGAGGFYKTLKFQCTLENDNEPLRSLIYRPNSNYNGSDKLNVHVSDLGNYGFVQEGDASIDINKMQKNIAMRDTAELSIEIEPVIDIPKLEVVPFIQVIEDTPFILEQDVRILHVDSLEDNLFFSLNCSHGSITLFTRENIKFTIGDGESDSMLAGIGTLEHWNNALSSIKYIPDSDWNTEGIEDDIILFRVSHVFDEEYTTFQDDGNSNLYTMYIQVEPADDKPEWLVPGRNVVLQKTGGYILESVDTLFVDEDNELVIVGVSISDVDMKGRRNGINDVVTVHIFASHGTIKLKTIEGLWFLDGRDDSNSMTWRTTLLNTNAALSRLIYRGNPNFHGEDELQLYASDDLDHEMNGRYNAVVKIPLSILPIDDSPEIITPEFATLCVEDKWCEIEGILLVDPDSRSNLYNLEISVETGSIAFTVMEYPDSIHFVKGDGKFSSFFHFIGSLEDINFLLCRFAYLGSTDKGEKIDSITFVGQRAHDTGVATHTAVSKMHVIVSDLRDDPPEIIISGGLVNSSDCTQQQYSTFQSNSLRYETSNTRENMKCNRVVQMKQLKCMEDTECSISGIAVVDRDSQVLELKLEVERGRVAMSVTGIGLRLIKGQYACMGRVSSEQNELTVRGTVDQINTGLQSLKYLGDRDFFGFSRVNVTVKDGFFEGKVGNSETSVILLYVEETEDNLSLHVPSNVIEVVEDKFATIRGLYIRTDESIHQYCFGSKIKVQNKNLETIQKNTIAQLRITNADGKVRLNSLEGINATWADARELQSNRTWFGMSSNHFTKVADASSSSLLATNSEPDGLWWTNVTIEGTIHAINRAIKDLVYLPSENWNTEAAGRHTNLILEIKKRLSGKSGYTTLEDEYDVHSVTVFIVVQPDNDPPLIRIGGEIDPSNISKISDLHSPISRTEENLVANEDEEIIISAIVQDVDDDLLTVKLEAENGLININNRSNLSSKSRDLFLVSGAWEESKSIEIKGTIGSLNELISEINFIGSTHYNGDDCSLTIHAFDSSGGSDTRRVQISVVPLNDQTELWIPIDSSGSIPTVFVNEGESVKIGHDWIPSNFVMSRVYNPTSQSVRNYKQLYQHQVFSIADPDDTSDVREIYDIELSVTKGKLYVGIEGHNRVKFGSGGRIGESVQMYGHIDDINDAAKYISYIAENNVHGKVDFVIKVNSREEDCILKSFEDMFSDMINQNWCIETVEGHIDIFIIPVKPRIIIQWNGSPDDKIEAYLDEYNSLGGFLIRIDGVHNISKNGFSLSHDVSDIILKASLTVSNGTITLSRHDRLSFTEGDGTDNDRIILLGTLVDINIALADVKFRCRKLDGCRQGYGSKLKIGVGTDIVEGLQHQYIEIDIFLLQGK